MKFNAELQLDFIETVLSKLNSKVRRKIGFSPNTYLVEVETGTAIHLARALNERIDVVYAEPDLIEPISQR